MSARTEWRNRDEGKKKANNSNEILLWAKKQDRHEHLILGTKTSQFISHKTKISYDDDDSKIDTPKSKAGIHDYRRKHSWSFWPTLLSQREGNPFCSTVEATGIDHPLFPLWISAHFKIPFINLDWPHSYSTCSILFREQPAEHDSSSFAMLDSWPRYDCIGQYNPTHHSGCQRPLCCGLPTNQLQWQWLPVRVYHHRCSNPSLCQ